MFLYANSVDLDPASDLGLHSLPRSQLLGRYAWKD